MSVRPLVPIHQAHRRAGLVLAMVAAATLGLAACTSDTSAPGSGEPAEQESEAPVATDDIVLVESVRDLSNPYHVAMLEGAQMFADSVGLELTVLANDADSQKQMSQIQTLVASGKKIVLAVEPQTSSDARAIVQAVVDAGGYVVTLMNKTDDLHPWDFGDNWVAHISYDNTESGYSIAKAMFEEMGGTGEIIVLRGVLDTPVDQQRYAGLERALEEFEGISVLDVQSAEFDRNKGFALTQTLLNKYPGQIDGVWASNDDMALGALQALKAAGQEGDVFLVSIDGTPEAMDLIAEGTSGFLATVSPDAPWQGGAALALAYQAALGEYDVSSAPESDREFNGEQFLVTKDNVEDFLSAPKWSDYEADILDPLARKVGPIEY